MYIAISNTRAIWVMANLFKYNWNQQINHCKNLQLLTILGRHFISWSACKILTFDYRSETQQQERERKKNICSMPPVEKTIIYGHISWINKYF